MGPLKAGTNYLQAYWRLSPVNYTRLERVKNVVTSKGIEVVVECK